MSQDKLLNEVVQEIINNRQKILDEFEKAYLAENMKETPIRNLVLVEQQTPPTEKYSGFGYRYWFEEKEKNETHSIPTNPS